MIQKRATLLLFGWLTAFLVEQTASSFLFHSGIESSIVHAFAPVSCGSQCRRNQRINSCTYYLRAVQNNQSTTTRVVDHKRKKQNPLVTLQETLLQPESPVLLIVDANNVRGKNDFAWTYRDLMSRLQNQWGELNQDLLHILCVVDHGCRSEAFSIHPQLSVVFAGPHQTADDAIVQSCEWFRTATLAQEDDEECRASFFKRIIVATSDGDLRRRCLGCNNLVLLARRKRQRQRGASSSNNSNPQSSTAKIQVITSFLFLNFLQQDEAQLQTSSDDPILNNLEILEQDMRWYQFTKPPWNSGHEKALAQDMEPWAGRHLFESHVTSTEKSIVHPPTELKNTPFREKTWHRIVFAEHWRRGLADSDPKTMIHESSSDIWNEFQQQYNTPNEESPAESPITTSLFQDTRISFQLDQQGRMLEYLQQSISSVTKLDSQNETASSESSPIPPMGESTQALSPYVQAQELMREFVQSSPSTCTQQHLLSRYKNEAPRHLQFSRQKDLRDLLLCVAEQKKDASTRKKTWNVKEPQSDEDDGLWTEPGRGRFGKSRRRGGPKVQDPTILQQGKTVERQWLELFQGSLSR